MSEVIDGELVGTELMAYAPPAPPATLFGTDDPAAVVEAARCAAQPLAAVVREQKLFAKIGPREHVLVEGWTMLGSMLGVFPIVVSTTKLEDGWEATVEARTRGGEVVGRADSMCTRTETRWAKADEYAIRSMAQTRATSKALRAPLGFVMKLAGYDPTPAEEMPRDTPPERPAPSPRRESRQRSTLPGETFEDIFEDAVTTEPGEQKASASQKKKLDVLVGQLRVEGGPLHTEHLYTAVEQLRTNGLSGVADVGGGLLPEADPDGTLHWSKLRETLTREEAHNLIDRLSTLQSHVEPVASRRADP